MAPRKIGATAPTPQKQHAIGIESNFSMSPFIFGACAPPLYYCLLLGRRAPGMRQVCHPRRRSHTLLGLMVCSSLRALGAKIYKSKSLKPRRIGLQLAEEPGMRTCRRRTPDPLSHQ